MKKLILFIVICLLFISFGFTFELPELTKPSAIIVDKNYIYIVDGIKIHVLRLRGLEKAAIFGKRGEGPGEFKVFSSVREQQIGLVTTPEGLIVHNGNRIIYFSRKGKFVNQINLKKVFLRACVFGDGYVLSGIRKGLFTISLFDKKLTEIKRIFKKHTSNYIGSRSGLDNKIDFFHTPKIKFLVHEKKMFLLSKKEFIIEIFDEKGKSLKPIKLKYQLTRLDKQVQDQIYNHFKSNSFGEKKWENIKKKISIPRYFPAIRNFFIDSDLVYIETFKVEKGKTEILVFDHLGNLQAEKAMFLKHRDIFGFYPHVFFKNACFQLVPKDDSVWELQVRPL